ncbi:hypothetical protein AgCh_012659 [Apium graveolens]
MPLLPAQQPWYSPAAASYYSLTPPRTTNETRPGTSTINGDFSPGYQQQLHVILIRSFVHIQVLMDPYLGGVNRRNASNQCLLLATRMQDRDGHFASSSFPSCVAAEALSNQRGISQSPADLSEKQQRLSEENAQLWRVIGTLKSELAEYKTRLTKLEADSSSPKPIVKGSYGDLSRRPTEEEPAGNLSYLYKDQEREKEEGRGNKVLPII